MNNIITLEFHCSYFNIVDDYYILKNQEYIKNEYGHNLRLVIDHFYKNIYISTTSDEEIPNEEDIVKTIIELKEELGIKEDYKVLSIDLSINKKLSEYMKGEK